MRVSHVTDEVADKLVPCFCGTLTDLSAGLQAGSMPLSRASEIGQNSYVRHPESLCRNEALASYCKHRRNKLTYTKMMAVLHFAFENIA